MSYSLWEKHLIRSFISAFDIDLELCAKFHRRVLLPSDNRTHPGLTETNDPIIDPGAARFVHLALLGIRRVNDGQSLYFPHGEGFLPFFGVVLNHGVNMLQIAPQIIKLS